MRLHSRPCPALAGIFQYLDTPPRFRALLREQVQDHNDEQANTLVAPSIPENLAVDAVMAGGACDNGFGEDGDHTPACPVAMIDHAEAWEYYMGMA